VHPGGRPDPGKRNVVARTVSQQKPGEQFYNFTRSQVPLRPGTPRWSELTEAERRKANVAQQRAKRIAEPRDPIDWTAAISRVRAMLAIVHGAADIDSPLVGGGGLTARCTTRRGCAYTLCVVDDAVAYTPPAAR